MRVMRSATDTFLAHTGVTVPLIGGPMYPCSNPELVGAVSAAGALGVLQPVSLTYVHGHDYRDGIRLIRRLAGGRPVGMNALIEASSRTYRARMERWVDVALEEGVRFVPKAQVALVETALPDDGEDEEAAGRRSAVKHLPLEIEMTSDRVLSGLAECELPPTRSRTLDFLNDSGAFLALAAEATLWAVHRAHIRTVRPMD